MAASAAVRRVARGIVAAVAAHGQPSRRGRRSALRESRGGLARTASSRSMRGNLQKKGKVNCSQRRADGYDEAHGTAGMMRVL